MRLASPARQWRASRAGGASVVPMINVVFLLLVFFLMVAEIAPPDPVPLVLPEAAGAGPAPGPGPVLRLGPDGVTRFDGRRGAEAVAAFVAALAPGAEAAIRADAGADAGALAALLARLPEGVPVHLAVVPR